MRTKLMRKSHVRKSVQYLMKNQNRGINLFSGLDDDQKQYLIIRILWLVLISLSFLICAYQIQNRIKYYLQEPVVVDACDEVMHEGDIFMVTICTEETNEFVALKEATSAAEVPFFDAIKRMDIDADQLWQLLNATSVIEDAYFSTDDQRFANATIRSTVNEIGTCADIFNVQPLPLGDLSLTLRIVFAYPLYFTLYTREKGSLLMELTTQRNIVLHDRVQQISVTLEKYSFLNRKNFSCRGRNEYEECIVKGQQEFYNQNIEDCSFPFIKPRDNKILPSCRMSNEIGELIRYLHDNFFGDEEDIDDYDSHCDQDCLKIITHFSNDYTNILRNEIRISLQSNVVPKMCERFAYDIISLLCDIGGNLGLFLGMSCLTSVDISSAVARWIIYEKEVKKLSKNGGFNLVSKIYGREIGRAKVLSTMSTSTSNKLMTLVKIFAFFLCIYQTCDRIMYYFKYPTSTTIELIARDVKVSVISCVGSYEILDMLDDFSEKYNKSIDNLNLLHLIDEIPKFSNINDLWLASSDLTEHTPRGRYEAMLPEHFTISPIITAFGNCTLLPDIVVVTLNKTHYSFKNFYAPKDRTINFKEYLIIYDGTFNTVNYKTQSLIRENTPTHPCFTNEEADHCEQQCYMNKLLKKNIECLLPYMNASLLNLRLCTTTKSARESEYAYFDAYMNTDAIKECSCKVRCNETIFWATLAEVIEIDKRSVSIVEYTQKGSHVEIKRGLSFPMEKLFCDIGSNFGIILGVSVLSIFQLMKSIFQSVKLLIFFCKCKN